MEKVKGRVESVLEKIRFDVFQLTGGGNLEFVKLEKEILTVRLLRPRVGC